ncbi:hypothetical protein [Flavobacterium algoritolerans]|jgi:hypothetical protein|uniref:Uncharacterized protein n=1 Tax=Flavobacterium algoritolerans TaxID=3041254 RepID=A0ABT6V9M3_9FLAO|nr:hypothetical protein [Flavobacterium algoritolerans]MDI5894902.1 hypothetical protein [Flavobacterium algoritolerans]
MKQKSNRSQKSDGSKKKSKAKEKRAAIVDCFVRVIVGKKFEEFYEKNKDSGREL